ncbi:MULTISPECIES: HigA family addiction module antitoxin [Pseudomonas]|jgi:addiction module HigA family antidote|uniref:Addiction module antidote protein, HigA family n=2 Tax=Pseudomonas mandelii TaxID=75612 RepID=A0ABY0VJN4_9PSED|nr:MULTISPECIES: HigA family addiction module antitoxin [Pseudomonas]PMV85846.1 addiction module antidote protein, HigA family [Pseudomonas sp. GW101-1A09]PMV87691.1 addiction module antidote protein, HigA family [Pseudomonas sp. FW306-2-2C-B10A]PMV91449.1 addiction module antidote protein, HigA family [Pseudomonas sp. GW460-C8]PMW07311.1 addiction module antidote protein, HigA family [Pseudomonas sp. MPR-TSA4]PMW09133.1 addiction module antidote protein, HigA family [Pseudomonas sp. FW306-2-1
MNSNGMRPVHPGEILQEEFLEPLGISESAFAHSLNEPLNVVNDIVMQQRCVSADLAGKLSGHLNTTPEFWLNLQATYDLREAGIERGRALNT